MNALLLLPHAMILSINGFAVVYHPRLAAVYHQHEVLYIIKPQENAR